MALIVPYEPLKIRLTLDKGVASWLRALCASEVAIFGDERATIVYFVRSSLIDLTKPGSGFREPVIRHLPKEIREAMKR
jgi:hypothetical protein